MKSITTYSVVGFAIALGALALAPFLIAMPAQAIIGIGEVFNVRDYGAVGDGVTNDHAAILSAINAAVSTGATRGGTIYFPPGVYCDFQGLDTTPYRSNALLLLGSARDGSIISTCNHEVTAVTLNSIAAAVKQLTIWGRNDPYTTHPALRVGSQCSSCVADNIHIQWGAPNIDAQNELTLSDSYVTDTYGDGITTNGGLSIIRGNLDMLPPGGCPFPSPLGIGAIPSWQPNTNYAKCAIVSIDNGTRMLMTTAAGTSGSSQPSALPYGQNINDGSATWQFLHTLGRFGNGIKITGPNVVVWGTDISGVFTFGILIDNVDANGVVIDDGTTFGYNLNASIMLVRGSGLTVTGTLVTGCLMSNCSGIAIDSRSDGDVIIANNRIRNNYRGIDLAGGPSSVSVIVTGNVLTGNQYGFYAQPNADTFNVGSNIFYSNRSGGNLYADIFLGTGSDHYAVHDNNCSTSGISGGGAAHSSVTGNICN